MSFEFTLRHVDWGTLFVASEWALRIGALIYVIRTWGGYPEGVAFAVLLMNAATPLIDRLVRPRRYGRLRTGNPLPLAPKEDGR